MRLRISLAIVSLLLLAALIFSAFYWIGLILSPGGIYISLALGQIVFTLSLPLFVDAFGQTKLKFEPAIEPGELWWRLEWNYQEPYEGQTGDVAVAIPLWMPLLLCVCLFVLTFRNRRLKPNGKIECKRCGYDLRGSVRGVCSECGMDLPKDVREKIGRLSSSGGNDGVPGRGEAC